MSGSTNDVFDVLSGELTALRRSVEHYGGTTLSKNEAKDLNTALMRSVERMEKAAQNAPKALVTAFRTDRSQMARETTEATTAAAERVLENVRDKLFEERLELSRAAGEARRAAWMYFGGFWVWAAALLFAGVLLGLLAAQLTDPVRTLFNVSSMVSYACEWPRVGGQLVEQADGSSFCMFWIETASQGQ